MDHVGVLEELHAADLPGEQTLGLSVQPGLIQDLQGHFVYKKNRWKDMETSHNSLAVNMGTWLNDPRTKWDATLD